MKIGKIVHSLLDTVFPPSKKEVAIRQAEVEKIRNLYRPQFVHPDTTALLPYNNSLVRDLIHTFKYQNNLRAKKILANLLAEEITAFISEQRQFETYHSPVLIPIPAHKNHRDNHLHFLLKEIKSTLDIKIIYQPSALSKARATKRQTQTSSRQERLQNVKESLIVAKPELVKNKDVIIIDDVTTTGATFTEAIRVLKEVQARNIHCIALAH